MVICAIFGCSKRSGRDDSSFFRIPYVDMKRKYKFFDLLKKRQKLWLTRIKRDDMDERKIRNARICNLHFISGKPSALKDVDNIDWAPSINLGHGKVRNTVADVERYQRKLKRQKVESLKPQNGDHNIPSSSQSEVSHIPSSNQSLQIDTFPTESSDYDEQSTSGQVLQATTECSTELTMDKINHLEEISKDYCELQNEYIAMKENLNFMTINVNYFNNDKKVKFYTGFSKYKTLKVVYNFVSPYVNNTLLNKLSKFQEFILVLMRLRLNLLEDDLGYRFRVSQGTVCRIFSKWLDVMYARLKNIVFWPEREMLLKTMPKNFKSALDGHIAVIIDCFEITINRPSSLNARAATWSNYKQRNTVKYLIGITPQGVISFISLGWGGRTSDKFITEHCGILNNLIPGDLILADRGFNNLNSVGFFCAELVLPASARGKKQLNPVEVENTRKIASLRIHVERVIGLLRKKFRILKGTLTTEMCITGNNDIAQIDKIVHVCCAFVNLMPSVMPTDSI